VYLDEQEKRRGLDDRLARIEASLDHTQATVQTAHGNPDIIAEMDSTGVNQSRSDLQG